MVLRIFSIFYVALYIKCIFMAGVYEDLVTLYLGPAFCCKVSCQFFKYEPFHKPIEGCLGDESFQTLTSSDSNFDEKFALHFFMDCFEWKLEMLQKNCPISWSKPFHCLGDKQCISHSKFCSHFNIPFNPEPIATKLASDGPVPSIRIVQFHGQNHFTA